MNVLKPSKFVRRIRRSFYLKYPFESVKDSVLPEVTGGYKKKVCLNEKYHVGRGKVKNYVNLLTPKLEDQEIPKKNYCNRPTTVVCKI